MSNDIRHILDRLATVEGRHKVAQLPALFKPKLEETMAEIEEDMVSRVKKDLTQYLDHLEKKGRVSNELKNKARDAIERGEVEEAGAMSVDTNAFGKAKEAFKKAVPFVGGGLQAHDAFNRYNLGDTSGAMIAGAGIYPKLTIPSMAAQVVADKFGIPGVKPGTGSWFPDDEQITNAAKGIPSPPSPEELQAAERSKKAGINPNTLLPVKENAPVRTYTMENGKTLECWGDEQNGFEIRHAGRSLPTRFPNLEHADIAVRLFQNRRPADLNQDYIEEK